MVVRVGLSVRFAHDIFFEWSFFHQLLGTDKGWVGELSAAPENASITQPITLRLGLEESGRKRLFSASQPDRAKTVAAEPTRTSLSPQTSPGASPTAHPPSGASIHAANAATSVTPSSIRRRCR